MSTAHGKNVQAWLANPHQDVAAWIKKHVDLADSVSVGCHTCEAINKGASFLAQSLCPHVSGSYIAEAAQAACFHGNLAVLNLLCPDRFPAHVHDPASLEVMLNGAISNKHKHVLQWFVGHPDAATMKAFFLERNMFPSHVCFLGDPDIVSILLPWYPVEDLGKEPLIMALNSNRENVAVCLLEAGAIPETPNSHLRYALEFGKTTLAKKLWPFSDPLAILEDVLDKTVMVRIINAADEFWSNEQMDALLTRHHKAVWLKECPALWARSQRNKMEIVVLETSMPPAPSRSAMKM